ncbi:unnamed protein product [Amoebophrya sp. A120]|nr:unnamed protein product [Amoebophrya sp. A120]|eukprot:GSA120T00017776001.1
MLRARLATVLLYYSICEIATNTYVATTALRLHHSKVRECSACSRACSKMEAETLCGETYRNYTAAAMKPVSGCNCEEDGWSYPYLNPGGPAGGQFTWKCCFDHYCIPEP